MTYRTSRHQVINNCGDLIVSVTPSSSAEDYTECSPRSPVRVRVKQGKNVWKPDSPLCLGPLYDPHTSRGRREAAEAAADFYAEEQCGRPMLTGSSRKRAKRRRR